VRGERRDSSRPPGPQPEGPDAVRLPRRCPARGRRRRRATAVLAAL
jgi:hypothetical protein